MILKLHTATFLKNYADYSNGKKNKQKKKQTKKSQEKSRMKPKLSQP